MDFILKKLNSRVNVSEEKSVERQTLLRERVEYMLFQALGVLWNKNINEISIEKRIDIVVSLRKMSIGQVVAAIRSLDLKNDVLSPKQIKVLDKYPKLRNQALGHGYTHDDEEENVERELEELYDELVKFDFFARSYDIVEVTKCDNDIYEGIRYSAKDVGTLYKWTCPKKSIRG